MPSPTTPAPESLPQAFSGQDLSLSDTSAPVSSVLMVSQLCKLFLCAMLFS